MYYAGLSTLVLFEGQKLNDLEMLAVSYAQNLIDIVHFHFFFCFLISL
jgi:hypothetical protein